MDLFMQDRKPLPENAQGRHMLPGLDALIAFNRSKRGRQWQDMASMLETFRCCIQAEANRADRAEAKVAFYEANTNIRPPETQPPSETGT